MKVTYYVASSMNGFIAEAPNNVDWLDKFSDCGADFKYEDFLDTVDGIIMGSGTYDFITHWGEWPYKDIPTWVCSYRKKIEPTEGANLRPQVNPKDAVEQARKDGVSHLWVVGGGKLAAALINNGLVDEIIVTQMPVILKGNIPLFSELKNNVQLRLDTCKTFKEGIVQLHYILEK